MQGYTILWLSKLKVIGAYQWGDNTNSNWQIADKAEFLNIEDYFRALYEGLAENMQEEIFIRQRIWWSYNDKIREGQEIFNDESDELLWTENTKKLKTLLVP